MTEEEQAQIKVITRLYIKAILELVGNNSAQVLVLIHDDDGIYSTPSHCVACAVEACEYFVEVSQDAIHDRDKDSSMKNSITETKH